MEALRFWIRDISDGLSFPQLATKSTKRENERLKERIIDRKRPGGEGKKNAGFKIVDENNNMHLSFFFFFFFLRTLFKMMLCCVS